VKRGKAPERRYLAKLLALTALATTDPWYVSIRYCIMLVKRHILPQVNGMMATAGLAQEILDFAVHPNQKRPSGSPILPIMAAYSRCSGGTWCGGYLETWGR
jgi:hypothetical protein